MPGPKNGWVLISDAIKAKLPEDAPFPAGLMGAVSASDADEAPAEEAADNAPVVEAADDATAADEAPSAAAEDAAAESEKD